MKKLSIGDKVWSTSGGVLRRVIVFKIVDGPIRIIHVRDVGDSAELLVIEDRIFPTAQEALDACLSEVSYWEDKAKMLAGELDK